MEVLDPKNRITELFKKASMDRLHSRMKKEGEKGRPI